MGSKPARLLVFAYACFLHVLVFVVLSRYVMLESDKRTVYFDRYADHVLDGKETSPRAG